MQRSAFSATAIGAALWTFFVDIDSGLLSMLRKLCLSPGALVASQAAKQTQVFREPLRLFLFANLIFFLVGPAVGMFRSSLESFEANRPLYAELALEQQVELGLERAVYVERFDNHLDLRTPTFAGLLALLLALVAKLFDHRKPFGLHLMFALYALSWILLSWPPLLFAVDQGQVYFGALDASASGLLKAILLLGGAAQWFVRAQRRGYGRSWLGSLFQAVLLTATWVFVMQAYEELMFWLTWALLPGA